MSPNLKIGLFFLGCGIVFSFCADGTRQVKESVVRIDGSSTVYLLTEAAAEEFRAEAPEVRLTIGLSGTGGGFKKFARGEIAIADASRPIKAPEAAACRQEGVDFVELIVAYDGLAVVVHPRNDWVEALTTTELKKIWEPAAQNVMLNWNQIRPGFPDRRLTLLGPGTASGTFDYFTEAIVGESGASRGDFMPSEDDHVLVQGVAGDQNALGFFGLAYYEENRDKLKLVAVDAGEGPVLPSMETVKSGAYRPLSRPLYLYVSGEAARRPEVARFVEFYLGKAAELAPEVGYVPLPEAEYQAQREKFRAFVDSEAYNLKSDPRSENRK